MIESAVPPVCPEIETLPGFPPPTPGAPLIVPVISNKRLYAGDCSNEAAGVSALSDPMSPSMKIVLVIVLSKLLFQLRASISK